MIDMQGICKSFANSDGGRLHVLKDIDLRIEPGEFVAVVGPSGSGKTTLMNILGLLDRADSGCYQLLDRDVAELTSIELAAMRNATIGFVFQQFHLLPKTTAVENVELPLLYSSVRDTEQSAVEALCQVGLQDRLTHQPHQLSGGQQQRVAIARALVNRPKVILADEPTGNLDAQAADQVMGLFRRINQSGSSIILITHDPHVAAQASRVVTISDGALGPCAERVEGVARHEAT